jgi:hypothetical protein
MDHYVSRAASCLPAISLVVAMAATSSHTQSPPRLAPIPDKLVVLTFDDSKASHYTVVRPLLKKWVFTEVNAQPLNEEIASHHARIGSVVRSPI